MKSITSTFFECKVRYEKVQETGAVKTVTEAYVTEAQTWTEAEANIIKNLQPYMSADFNITDIKKAKYKEVFLTENFDDNKYYKATVAFLTLDEKTGKEKRDNVTFIVQGKSLEAAIDNIHTAMKGTMADYVSVNATETAILDVFFAEE